MRDADRVSFRVADKRLNEYLIQRANIPKLMAELTFVLRRIMDRRKDRKDERNRRSPWTINTKRSMKEREGRMEQDKEQRRR